MFEIIILAIVFYIGYQIGMSVFAYRIRHLLYKEAKARGMDIDAKLLNLEENKPTVAQLFIEKANNMMYLYEYEDKTFICQATTVDELALLAQKYKNIKYAAVADGDNMLMFVEGLVKTK
jgi:hypothetical protein